MIDLEKAMDLLGLLLVAVSLEGRRGGKIDFYLLNVTCASYLR